MFIKVLMINYSKFVICLILKKRKINLKNNYHIKLLNKNYQQIISINYHKILHIKYIVLEIMWKIYKKQLKKHSINILNKINYNLIKKYFINKHVNN